MLCCADMSEITHHRREADCMIDKDGIVTIRITGMDGRFLLETDKEHFSFPRMFVNNVPVNNIMMI